MNTSMLKFSRRFAGSDSSGLVPDSQGSHGPDLTPSQPPFSTGTKLVTRLFHQHPIYENQADDNKHSERRVRS